MQVRHTDVAIVGAGTAGLAAYRAARAAGARALLIDGGPLGTTCARVGCMPSKLLIAAAQAAHTLRDTATLANFGIHTSGPVQICGAAVMARVQRERDRFVASVLASIDKLPSDDLLRGMAQFSAPTVLRVQMHDGAPLEVHAGSIVIASGAQASMPDPYQVLGACAITSDALFEWPTLPASVAVVGAGLIALELAQALARLGVRIRVFGKGGALGSLSDPAIRDAALQILRKEYYLDLDARIDAVRLAAADHATEATHDNGTGDGAAPRAEIDFIDLDGRSVTESFDSVLVATGRRPNLAQLRLEHAGLALDAHGVPAYDMATMQCGDSPVFLAGDVDGVRPWLNEAADEGQLAGHHAAQHAAAPGVPLRPARRRAPLSIVFSDPSILLAGQRRADLAAGSFVTGAVNFDDQGRAKIAQQNRGLLHVYADAATGRLLGAEGIAPAAEHIAHLLAWAVQAGQCVQQLVDMPFYHPVFEEGLRSALRRAVDQLPDSVCTDVVPTSTGPGV